MHVEQENTAKWLTLQVGKSACVVNKWCNNEAPPGVLTQIKLQTYCK